MMRLIVVSQMALHDVPGPEGELYTTYSDISGYRFAIIVGAGFPENHAYELTPQLSGLGKDVSRKGFRRILMMPVGVIPKEVSGLGRDVSYNQKGIGK